MRQPRALASLKERFPTAHFEVGDTSSENDTQRWIGNSLSSFGSIDCLVNNAAIQGPAGTLHEIDLKSFAETLDINFLAPVRIIHQLLPHFLEQGHGTVINISGGGATAARPRFSPYATSKAALVRLTDTLAEEYPDLRFYAIAPGGLRTSMTEAVVKMGEKLAGKEYDQAKLRWEVGGDDPKRAAELACWLFEHSPTSLNGRLISAIHDDYQAFESKAPKAEWWKLRRVDSLLKQKMED